MRNGVYGLRLPPEERRRYEGAARAEGLTLAAWLRRAARREAERSALSDEAGRLTRVKRGLASLGTLSAAEARSLRRGVRRSREAWSRDRR